MSVGWKQHRLWSWSIYFVTQFTHQYENLLIPLCSMYLWENITPCFIITWCIYIMVLPEITANIQCTIYYVNSLAVLVTREHVAFFNFVQFSSMSEMIFLLYT